MKPATFDIIPVTPDLPTDLTAALEAVANARHELSRGDYEATQEWINEAVRVLGALADAAAE